MAPVAYREGLSCSAMEQLRHNRRFSESVKNSDN
jgi:hypothetical protein